MMKQRKRWTVKSVLPTLASAVFFSLTQAASAQAPGRIVEREGGLVIWLVATLLILLVCLTGFLSAKRSHLH